MNFREEIIVVTVYYFSVNNSLKNKETESTQREKNMVVLEGKLFLPVDTTENIQT